jgi:hypothetical protein
MMGIYFDVAVAVKIQVNHAVPGKSRQHVIKEWNPCIDAALARSVNSELTANSGFAGFAEDGSLSHGRAADWTPLSLRNSISWNLVIHFKRPEVYPAFHVVDGFKTLILEKGDHPGTATAVMAVDHQLF